MELKLAYLVTLLMVVVAELESSKVQESDVCPRKEHLVGERQCKRACTSDTECKGKRKKCVCDDVCGLTCLNPRGKCPQPTIQNGKSKVIGKNRLGAVARYSCNKGYELQGVETRICNGDREWSGTAPICVPTSSNGRDLRDPVSDLPQNIESQNTNKLSNSGVYTQCPEPPSVNFADHNAPKKLRFLPNFEVTYKCRSPYISEGIPKAVCMSSGVWAGPLMTCKEDSCPDLGELANGVRYGDSLKVDSKVNYECKKGYRLIGSPTLTCIRGQVWDHSKPVCQLTASNTCNKPKAPRHGTKIGRSYVVGSVVTIICDPGYKLSGTAKRICQEDGEWSGSSPECLPIDCGPPGELWNGYIDGQKYTYGSVIRYRCLDGAKFNGLAVTATCLETGHWSFPVPQCLRNCARPDINNAQIFVDSRAASIILDHGDKLNVVCNQGLAPSDPKEPVCNNGTWSSLPICVQGGCDHRPREISNGMALYRGTKFGDRVRYTCNPGHKLVGDRFLTCSGGEWKGQVPQCKAIYCPHPGDLDNGKILLVGDIGKFEYRPYVRHAGQGEKIEYYCSTGYRLEGPSAATCIDGMWSPEARPKCINNQHPMLPDTQDLFTT